jgi:hypothetical protein
MSHKLKVALGILFMVGLASVGWAQDITKYIQPPDMSLGWNLQSQWDTIDGEPNVIRADNWRCSATGLVTDIHWWGSYLFNNRGTDPIAGFEISIHANGPDNLPSQLLYREVFDFSNVNEQAFGAPVNGEQVYEYKVYLSNDFTQYHNDIYWLDIVALTPDQKRWPMWGWHTAVNEQIEAALSGSAQTTKDWENHDPTWGGNADNPWQHAQYDMAFELTTIPEPSLVALFGFGVFTAWRRFRRT